jgi:glutaredoxin
MQHSEKQTVLQPSVTFYTKAGCHLCDEAREMLEEIATGIVYDLTEIDIRSDMALFEQYRYRIPVIIVNETYVVEGRIEYSDLLGAFQQ